MKAQKNIAGKYFSGKLPRRDGDRFTGTEGVGTDAGTRNQKTKQLSHTMTSSHSMTSKYKVVPHLPGGHFYSGDNPGAAAITIISFQFSSPRVSLWENHGAANAPRGGRPPLQVPDSYRDNRPETNGFPWYCHPDGRYSGRGTSPHPERPLQKAKKERRYVT